MFLLGIGLTLAQGGGIDVIVGDRKMEFPDVQPQIRNGRTLVPLRQISEYLGATVQWVTHLETVTVDRGTQHIELSIGDRTVTVNYENRQILQGVRMERGRLLVPLRFISENLGAFVHWDADTRTVHIWPRDQ